VDRPPAAVAVVQKRGEAGRICSDLRASNSPGSESDHFIFVIAMDAVIKII
jgi:hypothetical protein